MERFHSVPYSLVATLLMIVAILYAVSTEVELSNCMRERSDLKNTFSLTVLQNGTSKVFDVKKIASRFSQRTLYSDVTSEKPLTVSLTQENGDGISTVFLMQVSVLASLEPTESPTIVVWFA